MFKKVEDDLILGISKVISNQKIEKNNLLIDEEISDDIVNDIECLTKKTDSIKEVKDEIINDPIAELNVESSGTEEKNERPNADDDDKSENIQQSEEKSDENSQIKVEKSVGNDKLINEDFKYRDELFESFKVQIDYLKEQISIKDQQLQNKDELIRNFQVLMKHDKDRILLLENKIKEDHEDETVESVDQSTKAISESPKKSGFFSWFKK